MSDDWEWDHELAMVGGLGHISTISETPKKRKKKVYKRPIGFMADIDKIEEVDE